LVESDFFGHVSQGRITGLSRIAWAFSTLRQVERSRGNFSHGRLFVPEKIPASLHITYSLV
jgi:hypothetical protein